MQLRYLNDEAFKSIHNRPIYLVRNFRGCINDLCSSFDILNDIQGVFDEEQFEYYRSCVIGKRVVPLLNMKSIFSLPQNAVIILLGGNYKREFEKLSEISGIEDYFPVVYFFPNKEGRYAYSYRKEYEKRPLENIIIFRSGEVASVNIPGLDFYDNSRALFEYMLSEGYNEKYELVWLVHNPFAYEQKYQEVKNVRFLPYDGAFSDDKNVRDLYYEKFYLAKFFFFTDSHVFVRNTREGQIRVQLWHGNGLKGRNGFVRETDHYEYMTVISELYADIHERIFGLRREQLLITGLPKEDWLFHPVAQWRKRFRVPLSKKYIFWLPTFRKTSDRALSGLADSSFKSGTGLPVVNDAGLLKTLNDVLRREDVVLVIKLHPYQDRNAIEAGDFSNIVLLENRKLLWEDVQINELLGHADALISDYSSAAIDYLMLDRPIAFTIDDYEEYQESRGFHWKDIRNWLPGKEIFTFDDFVEFVHEIANDQDVAAQKRKELRSKFHKFADDKSCARVLKALGINKVE